jgi:hypothetical protein
MQAQDFNATAVESAGGIAGFAASGAMVLPAWWRTCESGAAVAADMVFRRGRGYAVRRVGAKTAFFSGSLAVGGGSCGLIAGWITAAEA